MKFLQVIGLGVWFLFGIICLAFIPFLFEFFVFQEGQSNVFLYFLFFCILVAFIFLFINKISFEKSKMETKEAFFFLFSIWFFGSLVSSFPFFLCKELNLSFVSSWFESVSALTTTGISLIPKSKFIPKSIILWKSILQWIGGLGIVVIAIAVFSSLRIGGIQMLYREFSDHSSKISAKLSEFSRSLIFLYVFFSFLGIMSLWLLGFSFFDATCHTLSYISTTGDSNISNYHFNLLSVKLITTLLMILGASPFILYLKCIKEKSLRPLNDFQFILYLSVIALFSIFYAIYFKFYTNQSYSWCLISSLFFVVSSFSSTGYIFEGFTPNILFSFVTSFIGGCTGSTSGGLKIFRISVIWVIIKCHLYHLKRPHGVYVPSYQGNEICTDLVFSIVSFIILYFFCFFCSAIAFSLTGLDPLSSIMSSAAFLGNSGIISPIKLTHLQKAIAMFTMILGRLEILTVFILLMPSFWRR